jgi:hypothetical protein
VISLDHLVRSRQHVLRNRQTDLLRGFDVNDELELGRLLDREITRFCAFEDFIDVDGGAPLQVKKAWA